MRVNGGMLQGNADLFLKVLQISGLPNYKQAFV